MRHDKSMTPHSASVVSHTLDPHPGTALSPASARTLTRQRARRWSWPAATATTPPKPFKHPPARAPLTLGSPPAAAAWATPSPGTAGAGRPGQIPAGAPPRPTRGARHPPGRLERRFPPRHQRREARCSRSKSWGCWGAAPPRLRPARSLPSPALRARQTPPAARQPASARWRFVDEPLRQRAGLRAGRASATRADGFPASAQRSRRLCRDERLAELPRAERDPGGLSEGQRQDLRTARSWTRRVADPAPLAGQSRHWGVPVSDEAPAACRWRCFPVE